MAALTLPVGSILYFDTGTDAVTPTWTKVSEHNRSPINIDVDRFEKTQRIAIWREYHFSWIESDSLEKSIAWKANR